MHNTSKWVKWGLFIVLAIIWGSSFKLMQIGLFDADGKPVLSAWQVASFRMFWAGLVVLPMGIKALKGLDATTRNYAILSGFLGSFFPAFLFCLAELKLEPSFAGTLNALTPIFVLVVGFLFFGLQPNVWQVMGITISFVGSILLFFSKSGKTGDLVYVGFTILATFLYGLNVNMVGKKLKHIASIKIASLAFSFLIIPSFVILLITNTQTLNFNSPAIQHSIGATVLLGVFGTTVASILFYMLMKKAGGVFASSVTYGIPFVAMAWGALDNEIITVWVALSLAVILSGIFIANYKRKNIA